MVGACIEISLPVGHGRSPALHGVATDLPTIGRLGALLVRTHHDFDPKRFIAATPQTEHGYASFLGEQLDDPDVIVLVAEHDLAVVPSPSHVIPSAAKNLQSPIGEVIGYSYAGVEGYDYMSLRGPAGALYDIVVDPIHRGHGVGRMLLDATLATLDAAAALVRLLLACHRARYESDI